MPFFRTMTLLYCLLSGSLAFAEGQLFISTYVDGQAASKSIVVIDDDEQLLTDDSGFVTKELDAGEHQAEIKVRGRKELVPFVIVDNEETHLIINKFSSDVNIAVVKPEAQGSVKTVVEEDLEELKGKVASFSNRQPISGVKVFVKGRSDYAVTNAKGEFVLNVPVGKYSLSFTHRQFSTEIVPNHEVRTENQNDLFVEMTPSGLKLDDFVVLAPRVAGSIEALIEVRRNSNQVADVMGQEQMAKSGDANAAGSLKRVTGLSLVDGKFVYVRGLGERYSNTLLNGLAIPSPDPSRRVVPLDLFPAGVVESLVVQKSYSPNRTGEFGGGTVSLKTNSIPEKFFLKASISQGLRSGVEGLDYQGGSTDWLGIDDGTRDLPAGLSFNSPPTLEGMNNFSNIHNTNSINENNRLPNLAIAMGNRYKISKRWKAGYLVSTLYNNSLAVTNESRASTLLAEGGVIKPDTPQERLRTQRDISLGGILGVGAKYGRSHELTANYILLRKTNNNVYRTVDLDAFDQRRDVTLLEWTESELRSTMLQGEHKIRSFLPFKVSWASALSTANLEQPDRRTYSYDIDDDDGSLIFSPLTGVQDGYERRFTRLEEDSFNGKLSVSAPFNVWSNLKAQAEIGTEYLQKDRVSQLQRYNLVKPSGVAANACGDPSVSAEEQLNQGQGTCLVYQSVSGATDSYSADQEVNATYVQMKLPITRSLHIETGARLERSLQTVTSSALFAPEVTPEVSSLRTENILPGYTVTYRLNEEMQLRAAYSETISRPDLRELSNTFWIDNERGVEVRGNPELRSTVIKNYDLRWEWYFSRKENVSVGLFYKDFRDPIEDVFIAGSDPVVKYQNAQRAENYGFEIEYRKYLGFMRLPQFSLSGNFSYIQSEVTLGDLSQSNVTSTERPLQWQSPYMINMLLDYENERHKVNSTLVYNVFGKRISSLGIQGNPDEFQMPFHQLDYSISKGFTNGMRLKFKVSNLINRPLRFKQGSVVTRERRRGRGFGLSLSMRL